MKLLMFLVLVQNLYACAEGMEVPQDLFGDDQPPHIQLRDLNEEPTEPKVEDYKEKVVLSEQTTPAYNHPLPIWKVHKEFKETGEISDPDALINATPTLHREVESFLKKQGDLGTFNDDQWSQLDHFVTRHVERRWVLSAGFTGGGLRGIIFAQILADLFKDHFPKKSLKHFFTDLAGTSTGGIYITLSSLGFTPEEALSFYIQQAPNIFPNSWRRSLSLDGIRYPMYPISNLGVAADLAFQEKHIDDTSLRHFQIPSIIPCFDVTNRRAFVFDTRGKHNFNARAVVEATAAAPTYFTPAQVVSEDGSIQFIAVDGGVAFNNPLQAAFPSWMKTYGSDVRYSILSFGTGYSVPRIDYSEVENASSLYWLSRLTDDFVIGSALSVDDMFADLFRERGFGYYRRYNTVLEAKQMAMDQPSLIPTFQEIGHRIYERDQDELERIFKAHAEIIEERYHAQPVAPLPDEPIKLYDHRPIKRVEKN